MVAEHDEVMGRLSEVCAKVMSVPRESVLPQARLVADLGADSLDLTELDVAVRDVFGVVPAPSDVHRVATVADVADLVVRLLGGGRAGGAVA
ncbi:hypothetical protein GCM10018793_23540 [Streptomyces sulfonofaciens]|uniref:Carrier domain-containing protein n=1 Tax=Streptomyces sulfonofaciens TaxID=68272 RepID=A0A919G2S3_9ACTN|nr:phosphopantetheine-binding protein [Streptomyces sulfonofaciens]GHH76851.1 hypothetical protein GCM10018793_23540 [Streptomyces sulfonofaciens]